MDLKNISSLTELREQRKKLAVEQRIAIDGVKQNFRTEKTLLTNRVKAEVNQVRHLIDDGVDGVQSFLYTGAEGVQSLFGSLNTEADTAPALEAGIAADQKTSFWEEWKLPALGSIAGLLAAIVTFWLTGGDEETEADERNQENYRPTEADEYGELPDQPYERREEYADSPYEGFERDLTLEQQIHAALATYNDDRQEKTQENILLAIAGMIVPVLLRELLNGTLGSDIKGIFRRGSDEPDEKNSMQDLSNSIADELEKVKNSVLAKEGA